MSAALYPIRKALVSVYDKSRLDALAPIFRENSVEVYSTGGTADYLKKLGGLNVITIESVTSFPEMMDGRVKTLHPKIFGGILARRYEKKDIDEADKHSIPLYDVVIVNLYPFWEHRGKSYKDQSAFIDIGGPSMLRASAKNCDAVTVLSHPDDYQEFIDEVVKNRGTTFDFRYEMGRRTFSRTAQYDSMISNEWGKGKLPEALGLGPTLPLRYGENPHQRAVWAYPAGKKWQVLQGKELSYNNLLDAESAWKLVSEFAAPACVIVKHNNPCGVGSDFKRAFEADSKSAFGGIVAFNRTVDADSAQAMKPVFLEVIMAPKFSEEAKAILAEKKNLRLLELETMKAIQGSEIRPALGGWLVQDLDVPCVPNALKTVTKTEVKSDGVLQDLKFAWTVCKHVRSNAIVIAKNGQTIGTGAGQMSRVDAVQIALEKAKAFGLQGAVLASDAFFPFRDNIDLLKGLGILAIIQPGGSTKDSEVIDACNEHGIAMVFTGERHFRH